MEGCGRGGHLRRRDRLIALVHFAGIPARRWLSALVMATYVVAEAMFVTGFTSAMNAQEPAQAV
ncbi:MAG: hypothetical protein F2881_08410 [Actinobacteria bacterium]|nr:hypothetical protein [Actinomycetota bacterium]